MYGHSVKLTCCDHNLRQEHTVIERHSGQQTRTHFHCTSQWTADKNTLSLYITVDSRREHTVIVHHSGQQTRTHFHCTSQWTADKNTLSLYITVDSRQEHKDGQTNLFGIPWDGLPTKQGTRTVLRMKFCLSGLTRRDGLHFHSNNVLSAVTVAIPQEGNTPGVNLSTSDSWKLLRRDK